MKQNTKNIRGFDPALFEQKAAIFVRKTLKANKFENVLIGLSGGVDSAVVFTLLVRAIGTRNTFVLLLPHGSMQKDGLNRAKTLVRTARVPERNVREINIEKATSLFATNTTGKTRKGNIASRVRMIYLYDFAKEQRALVVGTENKSEYLLGYFTRFGDEASDIELIRSIYKTEVYRVAKHLGISPSVINAKPTAGLWDGQTDKHELGFSYREADPILYFLCEKGMRVSEIVAQGYSRALVERVARRVNQNEFKHRVPYVFNPDV